MTIPAWIEKAQREGRWQEATTVIPANESFLAPDRTLETSEKKFQAAVIAFAESHGWKHWHCNNPRGSVAGFLDLVLVRNSVIFAELKVKGGRLSDEQRDWIECLKMANAAVFVWTPLDWPMIEEILTRK